ncbi:MAG: sigma-70 family RNA polymerase sigma factor [Planctomycetales bacterium]|nr:sigma-70 family RNA polymerase sigma factor [Planctomycetales bacterium]
MADEAIRLDPETLLEHAGFVRALARSLVRDEWLAEDVEQETWVAALERPPRELGALRGSLGTVVRNFARQAFRASSRLASREAWASAPEAVPSAAELLGREDARRMVVEAVLALEEPYRSAVVLRYLEELPPREVARRLGVPVETVKTRLKRAIGILRERFDARHGGDRRAWTALVLPLAAPPIAATSGIATAAISGGAVVAKTSKAAFAALALLAMGTGAWWVSRGSGDSGGADFQDRPAGLGGALPSSGDPPQGLREPHSSSHGVALAPGSGPAAAAPAAGGKADPPAIAGPEASSTGHGPAAAGSGDVALLIGRVLREDGTPVKDAAVGVFAMAAAGPVGRPIDEARSHEAGGFRLSVRESGRFLVVAGTNSVRPAAVEAAAVLGRETTVPDLVLLGGVSVSGRVLIPGGPPTHLAMLGVLATEKGGGTRLNVGTGYWTWRDGAIRNHSMQGWPGPDGSYRVEGLDPGTYEVNLGPYRGSGLMIHSDLLEATRRLVTAPADRVDLEVRAAFLAFEVRSGGAPLRDAKVRVRLDATTHILPTDEEGRAEFGLTPGGRYRLEVLAHGHDPHRSLVVAPGVGERRVHPVELLRSPLREIVFVLSDSMGGAVRRAGVWFRRKEGEVEPGDKASHLTETVAEGDRIVIRGVESGGWSVAIRPGGSWHGHDGYYRPIQMEVVVPQEGTVERSFTVEPAGRLRLRVHDAAGRNLPARCEVRDATGQSLDPEFVWHSDDDPRRGGAFTHGHVFEGAPIHVEPALSPGRYELAFSLEGFRPRTVPVDVRVGETADLDVTLERE